MAEINSHAGSRAAAQPADEVATRLAHVGPGTPGGQAAAARRGALIFRDQVFCAPSFVFWEILGTLQSKTQSRNIFVQRNCKHRNLNKKKWAC